MNDGVGGGNAKWRKMLQNTSKMEAKYECSCAFCLPWKYLPQPDGGVRDEGLGEEGRACLTVPYRIGGHQPGGDRQPGLSSGTAQADGTWDILRWSRGAAAYQRRLREVRSADRDGQSQPSGYVPHLRRRLRWQASPPDGLHRPPRRCCRPVVHRRLRGDLAGCSGKLPGAAEFNY